MFSQFKTLIHFERMLKIKKFEKMDESLDFFAENCKRILKKYLEVNKDTYDVSLFGSDGGFIRSNTILLQACSPYFEKVLENMTKSEIRILLPMYETKELKAVVNFIHHGTLPIIDKVKFYFN